MNDKPIRLSATRISMYLRCARQYYFRYIEGLKVPPSSAMKLSGVGHSVIEHNYRQKVATLKDLPLDEMTDRYATEWKDGLEREPVVFEQDETPEGVRDQGILAVKAHHLTIAPAVMPKSEDSVEEWFDVPL